MTYQPMFTLPDGHRIFSTQGTPSDFLIADESGDTPDQTDDGELFLDRERNLSIDQETEDENGRITTHCSIPLRTADGLISRTPSNPATIMYLAIAFRWPVKVRSMGQTYVASVTKV